MSTRSRVYLQLRGVKLKHLSGHRRPSDCELMRVPGRLSSASPLAHMVFVCVLI